MSTTVKITIEGGKTVVSGDGGLQVASPLSGTPESVTDASGTPSGLQLAAAPAAVNVATGLEVQGGATVTGGLTVDDATINGQLAMGSVAVADLTAECVNVAGASTLSGGATVAGGLTVDDATIDGGLAVGSVAVRSVSMLDGGAKVTGELAADSARIKGMLVAHDVVARGLKAETVSVRSMSTLDGGARVAGELTADSARIKGMLSAQTAGVGVLTAHTAVVEGIASLAGSATIAGGMTADSATVADATVTGQLTVHAAETVVRMFCNTTLVTANGSPVQAQVWKANTDGFLIAAPDPNDNLEVQYGTINLTNINSGLLVLPIACNGQFMLTTSNGMTNVYFFGMGASPPTPMD